MSKDESVDDRLLKILEAQQQASAAQMVLAQATAKRLQPKSLEVSQITQISPFNPRGEKDFPMARLKCAIYAPWKIDPQGHNLTREEVDLFNLLEPGEYSFDLNDGAPATMRVVGVRNDATGVIEQLQLSPTPTWDNEHKGRFRSMADTLRQMLGDRASSVRSMRQEKALIADGQLAVSVPG